MIDEKENRDAIVDRILKVIEKELKKGFIEYFSYAWREKINESLLEEESKYSRLVEWISSEIEQRVSIVNVFCPADKNENYTNNYFSTYMDQMKELAVLIHFRELLLDKRTTTQMRENIEYTVEKVFGVHYNDYLKIYT